MGDIFKDNHFIMISGTKVRGGPPLRWDRDMKEDGATKTSRTATRGGHILGILWVDTVRGAAVKQTATTTIWDGDTEGVASLEMEEGVGVFTELPV